MALATQQDRESQIDLMEEVGELQILLRMLGEEAIIMRKAGKLAEKEKSYFGDIVTEADKLIEREIVKRVQARYPDHCVRGEESGASKPEGSVCRYEWVVNPIDGTTNFAKGLDFFSIAVGLLEYGKPVMGIIYFPELSRFISAIIAGGGVFDNGKPLAKFERPEAHTMRQALLSVATTHRKQGRYEIFGALRMQSLNALNSGSMTYNCIQLAEGKIDAVIHTDASLFNIAAAIPILQEAGCAVSGFEEHYPDLSKERIPFIAASNQELIAEIKQSILPLWDKAEK